LRRRVFVIGARDGSPFYFPEATHHHQGEGEAAYWESRRLTMHDMARLQTFPGDVRVTGSLADAQHQLGNAVPSLLAKVLARETARQLHASSGPLAPAVPQVPQSLG
jgi:site-specific DNA-cytosine methylase